MDENTGEIVDLAPEVAVAVTEMFSTALDDWLDAARLMLNKQVRGGCWCFSTVKPCEVHDAYDDGICALIDVLQGQRPGPQSGSSSPSSPNPPGPVTR